MSEKVLGEISLVKRKDNTNVIKIRKGLSDEMQLVFAGMIIEVLADKHDMPVKDMANMLVETIAIAPMDFEEENK